MTRSVLVPTILALCAAGSAAALDHELAYAPLVVGAAPGSTPEYHIGIDTALKSKLTDDYRVVNDDTVLGVDAQFRAMGLGIALNTDWGIGQGTDYSRPGSKTSPGELLRTEIKLDYVIEIRDPRDSSVPLLQIIPRFDYITYPNQRDVFTATYDNYLKDRQHWLGVDVWWAMPIEGMELGGGVDYNMSNTFAAVRGGLGAREFIQYNSVDLAFWQILTLGDADYRNIIGGEDKMGANAVAAGGRATLPMFAEDVFGFVEIEASYWIDGDIRENLSNSGRDIGNVVLAFGLNWQPE